MSSNILLSPTEQKILLVIGFIICSLYFINLSDKFITDYNEVVESEQNEKMYFSNNEQRPSFSGCNPCITPFYVTILGFQFLTIPLLFLSLLRRKFELFVFSTLLTFVTFIGYVSWMFYSYNVRKENGVFYLENTTFNSYLLYNSSIWEFILFLLLSILFILQISAFLRFTIEKIQAKIFLNDKTSRT